MQQIVELIVKTTGRDRKTIRITPEGIYEMKESKKGQKRLFFGRKTHLRIMKTQIIEKAYRFFIKIIEDNISIDFTIEDKVTLEQLFTITGQYTTIIGLHQLLVPYGFRKIGEGAFAKVYEALSHYETKYALKSFQKNSLSELDKTDQAFRNEIDIMIKLQSPYLLPYRYLFESDKAFYLKMQLFEMNLKDKIIKSKLSIRKQKSFMKNIMMGLRQMSLKNIIHRDLKPDNIMIRKKANLEEQCVIIDFGLATEADAKQYLFTRCGTPGFLAPQIANLTSKKQKQVCASDMFSVGCIFYKMLTGKYLFSGKNAKEVLSNNRKIIYPKNAFDGFSVNQLQLIKRMLDPSPLTRIKPQEALKLPYFQEDVDDEDQIPDEECQLKTFLKKIEKTRQIKKMDSIRSSGSYSQFQQSTISQAYRRVRNSKKSLLKDSCLTFQLGCNQDSEEELRSNIRNKSRTPEKSLRQSRFSRIPVKDISNQI